jgi:hypothetical protein
MSAPPLLLLRPLLQALLPPLLAPLLPPLPLPTHTSAALSTKIRPEGSNSAAPYCTAQRSTTLCGAARHNAAHQDAATPARGSERNCQRKTTQELASGAQGRAPHPCHSYGTLIRPRGTDPTRRFCGARRPPRWRRWRHPSHQPTRPTRSHPREPTPPIHRFQCSRLSCCLRCPP